jgi:hypothetical protein
MSDLPLSWFVAGASMLLLAWLFAQMLRQKRFMALLMWPAFIYLIGPAATLMFEDAPVLQRYVFETRLTAETLMMLWYVLLMDLADRAFGLSIALRKGLNGRLLKRLSSSVGFPTLYTVSAGVATVLQVYTLVNFGSIFTGNYVLEDAAEGLIPYWGFLAGLYEIVFLCFVLTLLGESKNRKLRYFYIFLYATTTVLRVLGGTRLILIKELAFMIVLFYLRGTIRSRQVVVIGSIVVLAGSGIGLLRGGVEDVQGLLGPLYGLVMESALNALTLNIADQAVQNGTVAASASLLETILFLALSLIPSFLRFGMSEDAMLAISPYQLALRSGSDTWAPVGGMSGFASISYVTAYPWIFIALMVLIFSAYLKLAANTWIKQIVILTIAINAIHFWRDPADIAFKLLAQGIVICCFLALLPVRRRRMRRRPKAIAPSRPSAALVGGVA